MCVGSGGAGVVLCGLSFGVCAYGIGSGCYSLLLFFSFVVASRCSLVVLVRFCVVVFWMFFSGGFSFVFWLLGLFVFWCGWGSLLGVFVCGCVLASLPGGVLVGVQLVSLCFGVCLLSFCLAVFSVFGFLGLLLCLWGF